MLAVVCADPQGPPVDQQTYAVVALCWLSGFGAYVSERAAGPADRVTVA